MPTPRSWTDEQLEQAVRSNNTIAGVLRNLALSSSPGNYRSFHRHVARLGLDTHHFTGQAHGTTGSIRAQPFSEILVRNSPHSGKGLKKRLLKAGMMVELCLECGMGPMWRGKPLVLQLDHINGDPRDHRIKNLRLLCPNCHTQTQTFNSKNRRSRYMPVKGQHACLDCGVPTCDSRSTRCPSCSSKASAKTKIDWPTLDALKAMVEDSSLSGVGRQLGVSGNAVKKRLAR